MTLLRMLMISTASTAIPGHSERALDAIVPGFNASLDHHGIMIPFSTLIDVPLPVRPVLLAGLRFALEEVDAALAAVRDVTSGMHRTHLSFLAGELDTATGSRHWRA